MIRPGYLWVVFDRKYCRNRGSIIMIVRNINRLSIFGLLFVFVDEYFGRFVIDFVVDG